MENELFHYGMPRRSGRYPWGSGDNPYQHLGDFLKKVQELRDQNFEYVDPKDGKTYTGDLAIAKSMGLTTTQFRIKNTMANSTFRKMDVERAKALRAEGKTLNEITAIMGFKHDSSVRTLLNESSEARMNVAEQTKDFLKRKVDELGMIQVGSGVERELGNLSREKMNEALYMLELEGYPVYSGRYPQMTNPGKYTTVKVLCPPGTEHKEIYNPDNIHTITNYITQDGGDSFVPKWVYPESLDSKRLQVRYAEDGGKDKDGLIELRRNVEDISLGESTYAQVRIMVDGTHYLKGMAVYNDNMPDGVDVIFNTNKTKDVPIMGPKNNSVLKPIKNDPDNPFGSLIKEGIIDPTDPTQNEGGQRYYIDKDGKKKLSVINKRAEEGDWGEWANTLSSQFLGKQNLELINKQLNLAKQDKLEEFDEINSLTNPTVKKALLLSFAEDCDSAAVHLKAAALPRQQYQVILPFVNIKDNEVYAPNYEDGETVALIRYPHGGTFEIPILKVNNKNAEGRAVLGTNPKDAIGINSKVAERLSGADFDGDTVMVIPCNSNRTNVKIKSTPPLEGLKDFDPKMQYGGKPEGSFKKMKDTQKQMGVISNLITDMTLKGANEDELAQAVRHSMVVIDAEKHGLDYKQSEKDNNIAYLHKKYQGHYEDDGRYHEGASTLLSRAKSEKAVLKRQGSPHIDEKTGDLIYKEVEEHYTDKKGNDHVRMQKSTKMAETKDARTLSTGTKKEEAYAEYANTMKDLARKARLEYLHTNDIPYSSSANKTYAAEVSSLNSKLNEALLNAPREKQAQIMANSTVAKKRKANPDMTKAEIKKASQQALVDARQKVGAQRKPIPITPKEWEAIQSGAITTTALKKIINNTDKDVIRKYATPRQTTQLSATKVALIKALANSGHTNDEIAKRLGVSSSTVTKYL